MKKVLLFLLGLANIIPSKINIYEAIVDFIEKELQPTNAFYLAIVLGIWLFRILIVIGTVYEAYDIYKYTKRNILSKKKVNEWL